MLLIIIVIRGILIRIMLLIERASRRELGGLRLQLGKCGCARFHGEPGAGAAGLDFLAEPSAEGRPLLGCALGFYQTECTTVTFKMGLTEMHAHVP